MAEHAPKPLWCQDKSRLSPAGRIGASATPQLLILSVTAAAVTAVTAGLCCALTDREPLRESVSDSQSLLYKPNNSD